MPHQRIAARNERIARRAKRAIEAFARTKGLNVPDEAQEIADWIVKDIDMYLKIPLSKQGLLADVDADGNYVSVRLVPADGVEEMLYPIDSDTDEPVDEAVADYAIILPDPACFPEM